MSGDRGRRPRGPRSGLSVARAEGRARPRGGRATQRERQEDLGKLFRIEFQEISTHSTLDRLSEMRFANGECCEVSCDPYPLVLNFTCGAVLCIFFCHLTLEVHNFLTSKMA